MIFIQKLIERHFLFGIFNVKSCPKTSEMAATSSADWRIDCNDISAIQNKARNEARFTDVQFVIEEGETKRIFNAHKAILACGSPVFEKMFYGSLAEKKSIIETDDDPEAFQMLLNYIYGKDEKPTSMYSAYKYCIIGDKYLIPKVQEAAKEYIKSVPLTEGSFWHLIQNNMFTISLFIDVIKSYMMENTRNIFASENFLDVPEAVIDSILQMEKMDVSEYDLLLAVTKWAYKNIENASSDDLAKFYKHVRFSTFKIDEYFEFIALFPSAIDAENSLKILHHLHKPYVRNLPRWCSPFKVSRLRYYQRSHDIVEEYKRDDNDDGYDAIEDYWVP